MSQKKKLTIDARMIQHSGIGTYLKNLIPLIKDHFNMVLLGSAKELKEFDWAENLEIIEAASPIYSIKEQWELPLKIPHSDCFWSPHYNVPLFPSRGKKRLVTVHDVFHLAFFDQLSLPQKIYARQMFRRIAQKADRIITVSQFSKTEICKYTSVSPGRITVIHNGVNTSLFKVIKEPAPLNQIKKKYRLPDRFILFVGNIKPHKNLKNLILAFEKLQSKIPGVFLVVVGRREGLITGDEEIFESLKKYSQLESKIVFTASVPLQELPFFYNQAQAFILPSFYEGFGLPPLEAMACGCPVIVSGIEVLREVCGDAARYVDPADPENIAAGLAEMLTDEKHRAEIKNKGFRRIGFFSWEEAAARHIEVIEKLLGG